MIDIKNLSTTIRTLKLLGIKELELSYEKFLTVAKLCYDNSDRIISKYDREWYQMAEIWYFGLRIYPDNYDELCKENWV